MSVGTIETMGEGKPEKKKKKKKDDKRGGKKSLHTTIDTNKSKPTKKKKKKKKKKNLRVMPNLFHVIPIGHDTMLNRVLQSEDTTLGLSFITNVRVLLSHANHDTLMTRATHNRGEDRTRGIISEI